MTDESIERKARNVAAKDAAKKQRTRAVTIARTENAYAYNYGNDEAIKQAEAAGLMPHMIPYWSTAHSGNVCPVCEALEGMAIDEGTGQFSTTWHDRDYTCELPPMHPRCMCAVEYREETVERLADTANQNNVIPEQDSEHYPLLEMDLQFFADGKDRADQYSSEWSEESLQSAIEKFAKGSTPSYNNDNGKIIYKNTDSKYAVVYDYNGNYFRIEDTSIRSVRRYTDINGNNVANKNDNGRIVGRSKDEYQAITHFKNKDVEVY